MGFHGQIRRFFLDERTLELYIQIGPLAKGGQGDFGGYPFALFGLNLKYIILKKDIDHCVLDHRNTMLKLLDDITDNPFRTC